MLVYAYNHRICMCLEENMPLFNKNSTTFRANRIFVDRVEPSSMLNISCERVLNGTIDKKILVFYGFGGIGKSKFIDEFRNKIVHKDINIIKINLNIYEYNNVLSILLAIRKKLDFDVSAFDYAAMRYYSKNGLPFSKLKEEMDTAKSSVLAIAKDLVKEGSAAIVPGFSSVEKIVSFLPKFRKAFKLLKESIDYAYIDKMEVNDLIKLLPKLLADGINNSKKTYLIAFDDYESMRNKLDKCSLCESCDEWVANLIQRMNKGVFVFSSREKMKWTAKLNDRVEMAQYYLDRLSEEDARYFLEQIPIEDEKCIKDIIRASGGIPIYLDMCVDLYEHHLEKAEMVFDLSEINTKTLTERYMAHLNETQNEIVCLTALIDVFEYDFIWFCARELNLSIDSMQLKALFEKCLFEYLDNGCYKLDRGIRGHLLKSVSDEMVRDMAVLLVRFLANPNISSSRKAFAYFEAFWNLSAEYGLTLTDTEKELLFDAINNMIDLGHWTNAYNVMAEKVKDEVYQPFLLYIKAQKHKREGNLSIALSVTEELKPYAKQFARRRYAVELLETQILHLLGNYAEAVKKYRSLVNHMEMLELENYDKRSYLMAKLKYADLAFLMGHFVESMSTLRSISNTVYGNVDLEVEHARIRGHIMRFNLLHDMAAEIYSDALDRTANDIKGQGSLYNNLAEINCIRSPKLALEYASKANEINSAINAGIERGKTYAAEAVAYARLGEWEASEAKATEAIELQIKNKYKAGILFGYFALAYCRYFKGDIQGYADCISKMQSLQSEIGTYSYVVLFAKYLDDRTVDMSSTEWIEEGITERLELFLG